MIAPVDELTASTIGTDTKLVPVIVMLVASLVIVDGDIEVIVGNVPTWIVVEPPRATALPFIVIVFEPKSKPVAPLLTFKTCPAVPKGGTSLASVILKLANWNVP